MKEIFVDIIQFRGTHYDLGFMQGKRLKNSYTIKNRHEQWKVRRPRFSINVKETKQMFRSYAPQLWDELQGLQDALQWSMERTLLEFGGYRTAIPRSGCSIYARNNYFIRNYDYHPKTYDGRYILYEPTNDNFATVGMSQRIVGRCDGMNEKGLVMAYNFVHRRRPGDGFVCNLIGRMTLENCADVDEAVQFLKEIPHRGSFNYVVFDKHSTDATIIEASPRTVQVRNHSICTNHFERQIKENRHYLDDSKRRQSIIKKQHINKPTAEQMFQLFNDPEGGIFSDLYSSWAGTIHTSAYFPKNLQTWLALGGQQEPKQISFSKWLIGEYQPIDQVTGYVNTNIPFLHMEKATWQRH